MTPHKHCLAAKKVSKWRPPKSNHFFRDAFRQDTRHFRGLNSGEWKSWMFTCYRRRPRKKAFVVTFFRPITSFVSRRDSSRRTLLRFAITITDLPTPGKGKSGDPWKKSGDSTKNSEILFFPWWNPFLSRELDTNLIPQAYPPFKMADRRGEER